MNSTNQVAVAGSLVYHFADQIELGADINRLPGTYSFGSPADSYRNGSFRVTEDTSRADAMSA